MAINSIFSFFTPKENKFFPLIDEVGKTLVNTGETLMEFIQSKDNESKTALYKKIKSFESASDKLTDTIFVELNKTFITPFDREDIHELCEAMDDILDGINSSSKRVLLYQPKLLPEQTIEMCRIILDCCYAVQVAVGELKTINKKPAVALQQCQKLHDLEQKGDELYENFIRQFFEMEEDTKELIKNKEIMQDLERTTDIAKAVGKIIKTIIVKYA